MRKEMRKKLTETNLKEEIKLGFKVPEFKIKLTNTKKDSQFPVNLKETDYMAIKIGDYMSKAASIFEVTAIQRDVITDSQFDFWEKRTMRNKRANDLIKGYKNNSNFGACVIHLKPVLRGNKAVKNGRTKKIFEIDNIYEVCYRGMQKINIQDVKSIASRNMAMIDYRINRLRGKRDGYANKIAAVQSIIDSKLPETKIEVLDDNLKVVDEISAKSLI